MDIIALYAAVVATAVAGVQIVEFLQRRRDRMQSAQEHERRRSDRRRLADAAGDMRSTPSDLRALRGSDLIPGGPTHEAWSGRVDAWLTSTLGLIRQFVPRDEEPYLSDAGLTHEHVPDRNGMGWHLMLADRVEHRLMRLDDITGAMRKGAGRPTG